MARSRRRGGSGKGGQIVVIVVLAVVLVALIGGLSFLLMKAKADYVPRDEASLCPLSGKTSQTLVLIDTTDALAPVTQTQVLQKLRDVVAAIPKDGYLELRLLNADPGQSKPVLALCNPGDGSDIDPLTGNPQKAKLRWDTEYESKVEAALENGVAGTEQDYSPIMEVIQQIAAERLTSAHDRALPDRLIVISDMIQHTPAYSHFRDGLAVSAFEAKAGARLATDLAQAEVEIWMVRRDISRLDPEKIGAFWLEWAEANNAKRPVKLTPLMGMISGGG